MEASGVFGAAAAIAAFFGGELCARALTMKFLTDEQGNTCYDYFESTETEAAA